MLKWPVVAASSSDMATRSESWWVCLGFVVAVVGLWNNLLRSDSSSQRAQGAPPPRAAAILLAERYESPACRRARDRNVSQWMAISPSRHVQQLYRLPIPSSVFSMGGHSHVAYGQCAAERCFARHKPLPSNSFEY